jgi:hypothetical protein
MLARGHEDMAETHSEIRSSALHLELIPVDQALLKEMAKAREKSTVDTAAWKAETGSPVDNFRPYDQSQDFFVNVSKKTFLDAEHPAAVIDAVIERLDLEAVYADYAQEGNPPLSPEDDAESAVLRLLLRDHEQPDHLGWGKPSCRLYLPGGRTGSELQDNQ